MRSEFNSVSNSSELHSLLSCINMQSDEKEYFLHMKQMEKSLVDDADLITYITVGIPGTRIFII